LESGALFYSEFRVVFENALNTASLVYGFGQALFINLIKERWALSLPLLPGKLQRPQLCPQNLKWSFIDKMGLPKTVGGKVSNLLH
jgi:hypothetical protein